jgi:hypothetical protein
MFLWLLAGLFLLALVTPTGRSLLKAFWDGFVEGLAEPDPGRSPKNRYSVPRRRRRKRRALSWDRIIACRLIPGDEIVYETDDVRVTFRSLLR